MVAPKLAEFIAECKRGSVAEADVATAEKKGMATGLFVTHPLNGEQLPVWVANYVLASYGEGAVMAVPAHDERDFEFAKKYNLPIKAVIKSSVEIALEQQLAEMLVTSDDGYSLRNELISSLQRDLESAQNILCKPNIGVCINSGEFNGLNFEQATDAISSALSAKNLGKKRTQFRLRD